MNRKEQLRFLISELLKIMPQYSDVEIPEDENGLFNLFRALCNVRQPGYVSDEFIKVQDEMLKSVTEEKGITEIKDLSPTPFDDRIYLWQGDITTLKCGAIVNAANSALLGCFVPLHGCIDNMIHTMAGVELRNKCYEIMKAQGHEEETGKAKITPRYNLPAKYVIHTVGPIVQGNLTKKNEEDLKSCYISCLDISSEYKINSVAFCCISTGVFGYPQKNAAETAVETVKKWLDEHPDSCMKKVIFNVFKDSDLRIYEKLLVKAGGS